MSFKDKPLKKIVSDNRVTIDAIHQNKISGFSRKKQLYGEKKRELELLTERSEVDECSKEKINTLQKELQKCDVSNEEINYHLDCSLLLSEYYSGKNNTNETKKKEVTVVDFMNKKKKNIASQSENLINDYMSMVDDDNLLNKSMVDYHICPVCSQSLTMKNIESILLCEDCGYTQTILINSEKVSYKDPPRESSYFAYKRINHFNEWLAQFQAKETTDIPEGVYVGIINEVKKDPFLNISDISYKNVREILKKLKFNKYYEHIPHIINILNGKKAPILTRTYEEQLRVMFKEIQTPFLKYCPNDRKNFLSYSYVLHKFCQLLELDHLLSYFPLLKSREKLQQQDKIWSKICEDLRWQYIPSI
jgi:hypothetical protein